MPTATLAAQVATLDARTLGLLSGVADLDLTPGPDPAAAHADLDWLRSWRSQLRRDRVRVPFSDRGDIDADIATLDAELSAAARAAHSPDFAADPHGVLGRALSGPLGDWLDHAAKARGCTRPVRLAGTSTTTDHAGRVVDHLDTATLPDGVLYKPCGTRRASLCPACSRTYRWDTYQLIAAGLRGGRDVPDTVATHPAVFLTLTAPSFGEVHGRVVRRHHCPDRARCVCRPEPCHARRDTPDCPHGRPRSCTARHAPTDGRVGRPLCLDCYDHDHQAVWNAHVPALWDRTLTTLRKTLTGIGRARGVVLRPSYAKVAEFQRRGVVHLHAILRLDRTDPADRDALLPPPADLDADALAVLIRDAATTTALLSPPHPDRPDGWPIAWGHRGIDTRTIRRGVPHPQVTERHVAGYLAKYATKATETVGLLAGRLTADTIDLHADPSTHLGRLLAACWHLGRPAPTTRRHAHERLTAGPPRPARHTGEPWHCPDCGHRTRLAVCLPCERRPQLEHPPTDPADTDEPADTDTTPGRPPNPYRGLRRWAHMLGFGGHFSTKSRRYSTTLGAIRANRRHFAAAAAAPAGPRALDPADHRDHTDQDDTATTLVVGRWRYAGSGWLTNGDAHLAALAADQARARQPAGTTSA